MRPGGGGRVEENEAVREIGQKFKKSAAFYREKQALWL